MTSMLFALVLSILTLKESPNGLTKMAFMYSISRNCILASQELLLQKLTQRAYATSVIHNRRWVTPID